MQWFRGTGCSFIQRLSHNKTTRQSKTFDQHLSLSRNLLFEQPCIISLSFVPVCWLFVYKGGWFNMLEQIKEKWRRAMTRRIVGVKQESNAEDFNNLHSGWTLHQWFLDFSFCSCLISLHYQHSLSNKTCP